MDNDEIDDNTVMGWLGLIDNESHYSASSGVYDFFWLMSYDTRKKVINGWKEALDQFLDPEFSPTTEEGIVYITEGSKPIEHKIDAQIIQFPRKD